MEGSTITAHCQPTWSLSTRNMAATVAPTRYCGAVHRKFSRHTWITDLPPVNAITPATEAVFTRKYALEAAKNRMGMLLSKWLSHPVWHTSQAAVAATVTLAALKIRCTAVGFTLGRQTH